MSRPKILALVLAGGRGGRMEVLTDHRAKPALPYAGVYRLIDFSLSNLRNSAISDVSVIVQYQAQSIMQELANGRPWDLDRTYGGLRIVPPQQNSGEEGGDELLPDGNADAIHDNLGLIRSYDPDVLLVLSADHVYKFDYHLAIDAHLETGADAMLVTTTVPIEDASNYGTCKVDADGKVMEFSYKPEKPDSEIVTTEIFVYNPTVLIETLAALAKGQGDRLDDFGNGLIPDLVDAGKVYSYPLDGYWKDVGRPETYFASHMDLLAEDPDLRLDDPAWPILTLGHERLPAMIRRDADVEHALVSPGCDIGGTVEGSVLAPGVTVEAGATVRNAIILQDTVVRSGATVQNAIIDRNVTIGRNATVGGAIDADLPATEDLVLVGQYVTVHGNRILKPGERIEGIDPAGA